MANDSVGVAAAGTPTNYIDNESISTGGSPATVDRQRVRVGGANYTDLADVVTGDTGQGAQVVVPARKEVSFSTTTVQAVASTDASNFRYASVQITSQGTSSSITIQGSNDNSTWVSLPWMLATSATSTLAPNTTALSTAVTVMVPLLTRYFRLNVTGISSGTTAGVVEFFATPPVPVVQSVNFNSTPTVAIQSNFTFADAASNGGSWNLPALQMLYNGTVVGWDRARTPATFKTATATASGDTALWTPTAGKKFRLMRYMIEVTANAARASGGLVEIVLRDATTALPFGHSMFAPSTAITTFQPGDDTGWVDLGNGYLSALANNVLNINLSVALSAGEVRVIACGTEE